MVPLAVALVISDQSISKQVHACLAELPVRVLIEQADVGDLTALLEKIERLHPDVFLLQISNLSRPMDDVIRRIRRAPGSPLVVALHTEKDPEVILRAVRAGAAEYLCPPLNPSLQEALTRISSEHQEQGRSQAPGKAIAFLSSKGGCGATTLACHFAVDLQRQTSQPVLLADFDLETGVVGFLMKSSSPYTIRDAVDNINRLDLSYWKALISNGRPGLEVISAPAVQTGHANVDPERLQHILHFARAHYSWVVVDLGRSIGHHCLSVLEEVEHTLLVTTQDLTALYKSKHIVRTLLDSGYRSDNLHLVLNNVSRLSDLSKQEIEGMLGLPIAFTLPDAATALYDASIEGKLLPPTHAFGKQITAISRRLSGVREDTVKRKFRILG